MKSKILNNKLIVFLFIFSTAFFIYQHTIHFSWDFSDYVLNAKYLLGQGNFYTHYRAPLMPILLSIFSIFGWLASEYIFIILTSALFLYSVIRLSSAIKVRKDILYLMMLTPYTLLWGMFNGVELLSLSLLILFVSLLIEKKQYSGVFLGLAILARYNFIIFLPLLLLNKPKKIGTNIAVLLAAIIPWFLYDFATTGNMLTSIANSYALNVKYRGYINQPINYFDLFSIITYTLPLIVLGIIHLSKEWKFKSIKDLFSNQKNTTIMILLIILTIYQYITIPVKDARYPFPIVLPFAYFAVYGFNYIKNEKIKKTAITICIILMVIISTTSLSVFTLSKDKYIRGVEAIENNNISNCMILSNEWVRISYLDKESKPPPRIELLNKTIQNGNFILLYIPSTEPDWANNKTFLHTFPIVEETSEFIILGDLNKCEQKQGLNQSYIERLHEFILETYKESINTNPCFIMFEKYSILESACNFVNFKGFSVDENRNSG